MNNNLAPRHVWVKLVERIFTIESGFDPGGLNQWISSLGGEQLAAAAPSVMASQAVEMLERFGWTIGEQLTRASELLSQHHDAADIYETLVAVAAQQGIDRQTIRRPPEDSYHDAILERGWLPRPADPSPAQLLNSRYAFVPWLPDGRKDVLDALDAWIADQSPVSAFLVHGDGGVGKTRLAIEWTRKKRSEKWRAGFLPTQIQPNQIDEVFCKSGRSTIVVVDYAECRQDLELIVSLACKPHPRKRLRLLLLARNSRDWWAQVKVKYEGEAGALLNLATNAPLKPFPFATVAERRHAYEHALNAFSGDDKSSKTCKVEVNDTTLADPRFERTLYVHMAALATSRGILVNSDSLMSDILDHEERFWIERNSSSRGRLDLQRSSMARQIMVAATLRKGFSTVQETRTVVRRIVQLWFAQKTPKWIEHLLELLHLIYRGGPDDRFISQLEPDLLGEAMLVRLAKARGGYEGVPESWPSLAISRKDDEGVVRDALTVMARASAESDEAAESLRPWIRGLIEIDVSKRAVLALQAIKSTVRHATFSILGDELANILIKHGDQALAESLTKEGMPPRSVALVRVEDWRLRNLRDGLGDLRRWDRQSDLPNYYMLEESRIGGLILGGAWREAHRLATEVFFPEGVMLYTAGLLPIPTVPSEIFGSSFRRCLNHIASIYLESGNPILAESCAERALDVPQVHSVRGFAEMECIESQILRAAALIEQGEEQWPRETSHDFALSAIEQGEDLLDALGEHAAHFYKQELRASLQALRARVQARQRAHGMAIEAIDESIRIWSDLIADDDTDVFSLRVSLALAYIQKSMVSFDLGLAEDCIEHGSSGEAMLRGLMRGFPERARAQLTQTLITRGRHLLQLCRYKESRGSITEAMGNVTVLLLRHGWLFGHRDEQCWRILQDCISAEFGIPLYHHPPDLRDPEAGANA